VGEIQKEVLQLAKLSEKYELMVVFNTKLGEDGIKALIEKFKGYLETSTTFENVEEWGKRKLAYAIEDETEGYYVLMHFEASTEIPAELQRRLNITDGVLRSLITVA
jgi:small subunit ribosomal protein S6